MEGAFVSTIEGGGTSVKNLTDVYGHIDPEIEADVITRHMGRLSKNGFDMQSPVALTDD